MHNMIISAFGEKLSFIAIVAPHPLNRRNDYGFSRNTFASNANGPACFPRKEFVDHPVFKPFAH